MTHPHEIARHYVCGLCNPPARAGKGRAAGSLRLGAPADEADEAVDAVPPEELAAADPEALTTAAAYLSAAGACAAARTSGLSA